MKARYEVTYFKHARYDVTYFLVVCRADYAKVVGSTSREGRSSYVFKYAKNEYTKKEW